MKNRRVLIAVIVLVVLIVAIAGVFYLVQSGQKASVKTAKVVSEPLSVSVSASGKISADKKSDVFPPTQGTLSAIQVTDGQAVKAGQVIATLDQDPLLVQAAQARSGIAQGQAQTAQAEDQIPSNADFKAPP